MSLKKYSFKPLILLSIILIFATNSVFAHPGRTDSSGGHYVRKSGWGYPVGSYHYHNGGSSGGGSSSSYSSFDSELFDYQMTLNYLGYDCGLPDGLMGNKTISAIQNFQKDKGLKVTGKLDSDTKALIKNPNAIINEKADSSELIEVGITKQQVLKIMGSPKDFDMNSYLWKYNSSIVKFDYSDVVIGWINYGDLKAKYYAPDNTGKVIDIGMTKKQVLSIMGAPDELDMSLYAWKYASSTVKFDYSGLVSGWINFGELKAKYYAPDNTGKVVDIGMTRKQVLSIMGAPDELDMGLYNWKFGSSTIKFDYSGLVSGWDNKGNLKVK